MVYAKRRSDFIDSLLFAGITKATTYFWRIVSNFERPKIFFFTDSLFFTFFRKGGPVIIFLPYVSTNGAAGAAMPSGAVVKGGVPFSVRVRLFVRWVVSNPWNNNAIKSSGATFCQSHRLRQRLGNYRRVPPPDRKFRRLLIFPLSLTS